MFVGKVVGEVWATQKVPTLEGFRLLMVRPENLADHPTDHDLVTVADTVGAGIGERVIIAYGRAARTCIGMGHDIAVEAAVAGIVDQIEAEDGRLIEGTGE